MQQTSELTVLERLITEKGLRKDFISGGVGISASYLTLILGRQRAVPAGFADKVALLIGVPSWLFYDGKGLLPTTYGDSVEESLSEPVEQMLSSGAGKVRK